MNQRNKKFLTSSVILSGLLMSQLTGISAEAATIRADGNVNVRDGPAISAQRIDYAQTGQTARVLGSSDGWFLIELDGEMGFTFPGFWSVQRLTALEAASIRQGPDQLAPRLFAVPAGTEVRALGRSGEWILIEWGDYRGFSHKTYWDAEELLFSILPEVWADPADRATELNEAVPEGPSEELPEDLAEDLPESMTEKKDQSAVLKEEPLPEALAEGAERVILYEDVSGYGSAEDASTGTDPIGIRKAGIYSLCRIETGMYLLCGPEDGEGFWIDPKGLEARAEEQYSVFVPLPGHRDARSAAAGENKAVTVTKGVYFIYRRYDGMVNVSTSKTVPGAWIDPGRNGVEPLVPIGDRIVEEALELLGAPYLLGAESWEEGGFDCSGVTHFCYAQLGISLPRRASQQWAGIMEKVTQPRPGDIIAFEKDGAVYHVGLYIGDDRMIHAPKPGAFVKISDLNWWYENSTVKGFLRPQGLTP